ncbi:MAG: molybdenum cofactor guanylyltransferase MobA [Pseudomonadota bacterium]
MTRLPMPLGVILAGGQARRMGGGDKGLLPLGDARVIDHVMTRLKPQADPILLNANGPAGRFEGLGLEVIADTIPGFKGPLAGVLAGLEAGQARGHEWILTVAADTPFFPSDLGAQLAQAATRADAPIALAQGPDPSRGWVRHPTFGLWSTRLADALRAALEDGISKVVLFTEPQGAVYARFDGAPDPFFNINTPEDLIQAQARLEGVA